MTTRNALILSGGGARAAYQVGVLSAMGKILPKNAKLPFSILCGTSAGALNASMLAAYTENFAKASSRLAFVWRHLSPDQVYNLGAFPIASSLTKSLLSLGRIHKHEGDIALMDNSPLKELLNSQLDFSKIESAIKNKKLEALAITAMNYNTGESTTFFEAANHHQEWKESRRKGAPTKLGVDHLLASSALPMIFPAHKIGGNYYGDGAIRQKSAIQPALKLGAQKLFIIGVSGNRSPKKRVISNQEAFDSPSMAQILGQLLNSAFIDNLEDDIQQLDLINRLVQDLPEEKQVNYQDLPKETFIISPSEDLSEIANEHIDTLPKNIRSLLKSTGSSNSSKMSSAASYLLFTPQYCRALIELGHKDTMWEKERVIEFFQDNMK